MDNYNEKEFSIGDLIKLEISRNDFDDLGSVLQLNYTHLTHTNHIITMSFYDDNHIQINQKSLLLLCNYENILFDNVVMLISIKSNNQMFSYSIKLLNKEIAYMKLFVQASPIVINKKSKEKGEGYSFSQLFDLRSICTIDTDSFTEVLKQGKNTLNGSESKNDNLEFIISELDKINQSLISEKEKVDQSKRVLKEKESKINQMITKFKEEMMLFSDKCYGECHNEISQKMGDLQKKMNLMETNITNKYRIIKGKLKTEPNTLNTASNNDRNTKNNNKDKLANLEIKLSFLEDTNNTLKTKLQEKENEMKLNIMNEEKQNKIIKKLKDDLVLMQSQLKEKKEKSANVIVANNSSNKNLTQTQIAKPIKQKKLISVEINKIQLENYNNMLILSELVSNNQSISFQFVPSEKETQIISLLLMHLMINPINLYNKFPFCYSLIMNKILPLLFITLNKSIISQIEGYLTEFSIKFPELKAVFSSNQSNINLISNEEASLISIAPKLNEIEINCNEILLSKARLFNGFMIKSKDKLIEKNNAAMFKYIILSNVIFSLILVKDKKEVIKIGKEIYQEYILKNDNCAILFLIKRRYIELLLLLINNINSINSKSSEDLLLLLIDSMLSIISLGYSILTETINKDLFNTQNNQLLKKVMINNENTEKIIILLTLICFEYPLMRKQLNDFKKELEAYASNNQRIKPKLINSNLDILNKYID